MSLPRVARGFRRTLFGLACGLLAAIAWADEPCRVAFDMGSSGIRAGASGSSVIARADIDYLGPLWSGRGSAESAAPTIAALRNLPEQGGFAAACARIGGGFSAWRFALQREPGELAATLARIRSESGVPVLVMPQIVEGAYGYFAARQLLGNGLATSHVLDIGGGSLQVAGEWSSFGAALGQKIWHRELCHALRQTDSSPCVLQPVSGDELVAARALLQARLQGIEAALPARVTMTAISRPVTRGVLPAVARVAGANSGAHRMSGADISAAIDRIAPLTPEASAVLTGSDGSHAAYLLSDLLLVEGLMQATGGQYLDVAEIDVTNLPGLLADDRAFAWGKHYDCYLERLVRLGADAYASDPASCPDDGKRPTGTGSHE